MSAVDELVEEFAKAFKEKFPSAVLVGRSWGGIDYTVAGIKVSFRVRENRYVIRATLRVPAEKYERVADRLGELAREKSFEFSADKVGDIYVVTVEVWRGIPATRPAEALETLLDIAGQL